MLSLLDLSFSGGGLFSGARLREMLEQALGGKTFEDLPIPFAAVATEISSGHEIWLRNGPLARALPASYALPGLLEPALIDGRWLFDGALVNPIPVSVCRALGADLVVAINLVSDSMFRGTVIGDRNIGEETTEALVEKVEESKRLVVRRHAVAAAMLKRTMRRGANDAPGVASVMLDAFSITQDRIARSRLAGDPPDVMINVRLEQFGLFDFHRARGDDRDRPRRRATPSAGHRRTCQRRDAALSCAACFRRSRCSRAAPDARSRSFPVESSRRRRSTRRPPAGHRCRTGRCRTRLSVMMLMA